MQTKNRMRQLPRASYAYGHVFLLLLGTIEMGSDVVTRLHDMQQFSGIIIMLPGDMFSLFLCRKTPEDNILLTMYVSP